MAIPQYTERHVDLYVVCILRVYSGRPMRHRPCPLSTVQCPHTGQSLSALLFCPVRQTNADRWRRRLPCNCAGSIVAGTECPQRVTVAVRPPPPPPRLTMTGYRRSLWRVGANHRISYASALAMVIGHGNGANVVLKGASNSASAF